MRSTVVDVVGGHALVEVTFLWSEEHGKCYNCGAPAAYVVPHAYTPGHVIEDHHKRCSVCAAEDAADGEPIERLFPRD